MSLFENTDSLRKGIIQKSKDGNKSKTINGIIT